ncbi:putative Rho guanyl nucleotide exchange factor [Talaromyces proteolyticus]|uniref:Rho guanyl nucleotide exchange factor n=1 Tax=Talaromyces proteolyticus TaxID=1131652 RepID=A0AAD4KX45_9EURO|nr:putative Rho guanyl nucleotide exchange factor [Talaromyces proteolyticus]KAH8703150.1 putative Rho guanyl nucleotide exchange factor [Talaromyces proteolyticus]
MSASEDLSRVSFEDEQLPGFKGDQHELLRDDECFQDQKSSNSVGLVPDAHASYPWTRWVESLRSRRKEYQPATHVDGWFDEPPFNEKVKYPLAPSSPVGESVDQLSVCSSILGRVKTASISIPTSSDLRSMTNTIASSSIKPSRKSMDSTRSALYGIMNHANKARAVKRRHVLREIYSSEANYVHGLQTLVQLLSAYLTMRPTVLRDLRRLYDMHDAFKKRLEIVSPLSTEAYRVNLVQKRTGIVQKIHNRPVLKRNIRRLVDGQLRKDTADPAEALMVAMEIDDLTAGFGLYESFIDNFDVLVEDLSILRQTRPADGFWAEGVEALSKSVDSTQRRKENGKNSLTVDDLIAKPVQRVCKYRLLLSELLKTLPEPDYPSVHSKVKWVLDRNIEAVDTINTIVGNPYLRMRIEKTVSLHERLEYGDQTIVENVYQDLGPFILCGVLHVAYSSLGGVDGQYLVCILFSSYIVLAKPAHDSRKLILVASIYLTDMTVDTLMNGQGVACFDTPFSWKVVFQYNKNRYELILSASSASEERNWKTEILKASAISPEEIPTLSLEPRRFSLLSIPLQTLESDGRSLLLSRTASLRSLSSHSFLRAEQPQVIIKKTYNPVYDSEVRLLQDSELTRSRSVAKTNIGEPTILAPLRWSRVKLERSIADIFSHEILPYPGMTLGRTDYLQTQTMMRKSIIRGLSLRGVFSNRRSASLGKATSLSVDSGWEIMEDEKEMDTANSSNDADMEAKSESIPLARTQSMQDPRPKARQSLARATSDNLSTKLSDTKSKSQARSLWKRWPSSLSVFGLFSNRSSGTE